MEAEPGGDGILNAARLQETTNSKSGALDHC